MDRERDTLELAADVGVAGLLKEVLDGGMEVILRAKDVLGLELLVGDVDGRDCQASLFQQKRKHYQAYQ